MKLFSIFQDTLATYQSNLARAREDFDLSDFVNRRQSKRLDGEIGHLYIYGPLLRDSSPIDRALGCTDYSEVISDLTSLVEQGARAIVLHVDSGGGMVAGCIEAAEIIQNCPVPTVAYVDGLGCSAAYKLLCGATHIIASKSAQVGNIGTIHVTLDTSVALEKMGISFVSFVNDGATLKSTGHMPGLSEEQKEFLQESINEAGAAFKEHVLANRPDIDPEVWKAGWYSGQRALSLGLIDEIGGEALAVQRAQELADLF